MSKPTKLFRPKELKSTEKLRLLPFDDVNAEKRLKRFIDYYFGDIDELYITLQYLLINAMSGESFSSICVAIVRLRRVFREQGEGLSPSSDVVFESYLKLQSEQPPQQFIREIRVAIEEIYKGRRLTKDGYHHPILMCIYRVLVDMAMKNPDGSRPDLAGLLLHTFLDQTDGNMDSVDKKIALALLQMIENAEVLK